MTYFRQISCQVLSALALLLGSSVIWAQEAATTLFAQGEVTTESAHLIHPAFTKAIPVFKSDRVTTQNVGRVQLRFSDAGLGSLLPATSFAFEEHFYGETLVGSLVFGLLKGGLRTLTGT